MSAVLTEFQQSVLWHVMTGKLEVTARGHLKPRTGTGDRRRLKDLARLSSGTFNSNQMDHGGKVPFFKATRNNPCGTHSVPSFYCTADYIVMPKDGGSPRNIYGDAVGMGTSFMVSGAVAATTHCYFIYPNSPKTDMHWIHWALRAAKQELNSQAIFTTGLGALKSATVLNFALFYPPPEERERILAFIEKFTSAIPDPAPAIKALDEWYQSTLWHVMTGKLEVTEAGTLVPALSLNQTTDWYGGIPSQWTCDKLGQLGSVVTGKTPVLNKSGQGNPFYRPNHLGESLLATTGEFDTDSRNPTIPHGVMTCCIGGVGKTAYTGHTSTFNQQINAFHTYDPQLERWVFLIHQLPTFKGYMLSRSSATTLSILNASAYKQLRLPLPPVTERQRILDFVTRLQAEYKSKRAQLMGQSLTEPDQQESEAPAA